MSRRKSSLKRQALRNNEYYDFQNVLDNLHDEARSNKVFRKLVEIIQQRENILLAYRNIKNNKGSRTAGTDGRTIQYLARMSQDRMVTLIQRKLANFFPQTIRRVYIPKPDGRKRPLGIPTITDRLVQQCILQVLDPICEAKFFKHSYGFRPLRSAKHALARAYFLAQKANLHYVVDIDIKGFFDNIDHGKLLKQLWALGVQDKSLLKILSKMLKAEIEGEGIPEKGTPQGGIISPLLANVALNELDWWVSSQWENAKTRREYKVHRNSKYSMYSNLRRASKLKEIYIVRYADDFKIFCRTHDHAIRTFNAVQQWLRERLGLEISQEKSKITNLRKSNSEFLGIRMKVKPKGKSITRTGSKRNNFVVESHITDKVMEKIRGEIRHHARRMQRPVQNKYKLAIGFYNAYVLGVHEYYNCATHCSKEFADIAYRSRTALRNRLTLRRRRKDDVVAAYIEQRYGKSLELRFHRNCPILPIAYISYQTCLQHSGINRYAEADRQLIHQKQRAVSVDAVRYLLTHPVLDRSVEYNDNRLSLFVAQYGKCAVTQRVLNMEDVHCHHRLPRWLGGGDKYANLVIVSNDVHRLIHATTHETITHYLQRTGLTAAMLKKLNVLRELAKLEPIS